MSGQIDHVSSSAQLNTWTAKHDVVVIDFFAQWCGPCHAIAPFYEQMAKKYTAAKFLKVDVDAAQAVARDYSIRAMPTFVFLKKGKKVDEIQGANRNAIETALKKHLGGATSNPNGHSWGSGQKLGDGAASSAPVHPQQLVEKAKGLSPQLLLLIGLVAVYVLYAYKG